MTDPTKNLTASECCKKYNGWLISTSFWKRSLSTFGYAAAGYLIFAIVMMIVFGIVGLLGMGIDAL